MPTRRPRRPRRSDSTPDEPPQRRDSIDIPIEEEDYHDWLEPIGNTGFYQTPAEPVDPTDCDRWPDSPFCGGTGLDPENLAGLGVEVGYNDCEICITVSPTLAFISLPPYTVCYRKEGCIPTREEPPKPQPGTIDPVDQQLIDYLRGFPPGCRATIQYARWWTREIVNGFAYSTPPNPGAPGDQLNPQIDYRGNVIWNLDRAQQVFPGISGGATGMLAFRGEYQTSDPQVFSSVYEYQISTADYRLTELILWTKNLTEFYYDPRTGDTAEINSGYTYAGVIVGCAGSDDQGMFSPSTIAPIPAPPIPPLPPMDCCNETLELTRLIAKRLGTDSYPVSYPKSLLTDRGEGQVKLESLTALIDWFVGEFDALVGQFPAEIEIEDIDPTKAGNQKKKIKLPNLAESIAEIYGLTLRQSVDADVTISFLLRLATETMAAKNAAIVAQDYARANASYLGYKGNKVERKIDYAFDPTNADSIDGILKETTKKLLGWEEDDPETLAAYLQKLMFSAGIIKAVFFRGGQLQGQLLKEAGNLINRPERADEDRLWKQFIDALNNPAHRINTGNAPDPKVRDLSTTNIQGLSNLMNES